jgi:hypothetical protein
VDALRAEGRIVAPAAEVRTSRRDRGGAAGIQEPAHAFDDDARLAGARPGDDDERPVRPGAAAIWLVIDVP